MPGLVFYCWAQCNVYVSNESEGTASYDNNPGKWDQSEYQHQHRHNHHYFHYYHKHYYDRN